MTKIKIEKGVLLTECRRSSMLDIYPLDAMEPGDSFFVPQLSAEEARALRSFATRYAKPRGLKFAVRRQGGGGFRLWRIV